MRQYRVVWLSLAGVLGWVPQNTYTSSSRPQAPQSLHPWQHVYYSLPHKTQARNSVSRLYAMRTLSQMDATRSSYMLSKMLDADEEAKLWGAIVEWRKKGDDSDEAVAERGREAKRRLVASNLRLVLWVSNAYRDGLPDSDALQEGALGLARAVDKFDPSRGVRFATYATYWIRQSIRQASCWQSRTIRLPVHVEQRLKKASAVRSEMTASLGGKEPSLRQLANELGQPVEKLRRLQNQAQSILSIDHSVVRQETSASLSDAIGDDTADGLDLLEAASLRRDVACVLDSGLTPRERQVVDLRFGLTPGTHARSFANIASIIGCSRERARTLQLKALRKLRSVAESDDALDLRTRAAAVETSPYLADLLLAALDAHDDGPQSSLPTRVGTSHDDGCGAVGAPGGAAAGGGGDIPTPPENDHGSLK